MKRNHSAVLFSILLFFSGITPIVFAQTWRCGNLIVDAGVQSFLVLENCGEPLSREVIGYTGGSDSNQAQIIMEKWVYGPDAGYYYFLYFRGGTLDHIETVRQP